MSRSQAQALILSQSDRSTLSLRSPGLLHLVGLELKAQADDLGLPPQILRILEEDPQRILRRLNVSVDVAPLLTLAEFHEDQSWETEALKFFVLRGAPAHLLRELFGASRFEVRRLRQQLGVSPPPARVQKVPEELQHEIWLRWQEIKDEYEREADRWIQLSNNYPALSISTLHQVLHSPDVLQTGGRKFA